MTAIHLLPTMPANGQVVPPIRTVATVGSTNDELMAAPLRLPPTPPQVLWAETQTKGRGRRGRQWVSRPGDSVTFSVAFERCLDDRSRALAGLSLAIGVALAEALAEFDCHLALKWPNDLFSKGCKVGGILVETRRERQLERIVVGVGLNLVAPGEIAAAGAGQPPGANPGGLFAQPVAPATAAAIVAHCAAAIVTAYDLFVASGFGAFRERWMRRNAFRGARVQLHDGARLLAVGEVSGLGEAGELRLTGPEGERQFTIGEVSLRLDQNAE
ncbi:MAG: biotin--[acetyl-CoA-carboxylase] ligase [Burkholderiaceae bacterium]|nr:biotin--[acetyl-CoA-carboxylase] ligase [Burkholderiaceae bacterium]